MKKKRRLKKKVLVILIILGVFIFSLGSFFCYKTLNQKQTKSTKIVDNIEEYDYTLENNQPKIYKDLFKELSNVLKEEEVDYDKYASLIAQMAAIDFYNLDNKTSKNDVGAVQFIKKENQENFILEASETVYKYIEQNISGTRKQELPIVTKSEVKETKQESYKYKKINDDKAYNIVVSLEYKEDLGYPKSVTIKLLHNDKKLEIYQMK